MTKKQKKILSIIAIAVIACIAIGFAVYTIRGKQIYGDNGVYYSQQGTGEYLQFKSDKSFSFAYNPKNDLANPSVDSNIQAEILNSGKWKEENNKVILEFSDSGNNITFIKKGEYIYREDTVYKGKIGDEKLLNNRFVIKENDKVVEELWFLDDGTVDYKITGVSKMRHGTYTRVDDVLTVRFDDTDYGTRFLVVDGGISMDIYAKTPVEN